MPLTAAVWDLGSSSFHVLVCQVGADGSLRPVSRRRSLLNLGAAVGVDGTIPPDRVRAALSAARRLRRQLDEHPADVTVALATAALRDAANGAEVVARLQRVIGSPVRILDGPEEARLCFVGQRAGVWSPAGPVLGLDVGGGSLELAVGDARAVTFAVSVPVGATRLRAELAVGDPLRPGDVVSVRSRVAEALAPVRAAGAVGGLTDRVLASGGTVRALARLATARARRRPELSSEVNQVELPSGQVRELAERLAGLTLAQRLALPGMPGRRAPVVAVGAAILAAAAAELGVDRFVVSEWGLREGALLDALARG